MKKNDLNVIIIYYIIVLVYESTYPAHKKRIQALKNQMEGFKSTKKWLTKNMDSVIKFIETRYGDVLNSKSGYLSSVRSLAEVLDLDPKIIEKLSRISTEYSKEGQIEVQKGKLKERQATHIHSFVCYSSKRDELLDLWIQTINNRKSQKKEPTIGEMKLMYKMLIMSMLTLEPPKRTSDYLNVEILGALPKGKPKENFLLIEGYQCTLYINVPAKATKAESKVRKKSFHHHRHLN